MNISEIQNKILELKKEKDVCILAHSYQAREICEIADFTGDSYKLSVDASKVTNKNILMCGVRFMAETCKILSPDKTVYLAQPSAGCQMADQMDKEMISSVKEMYPDYAVVAYINTTADVKKAKAQFPNAELLVHPECQPAVVDLADYVGSTSGIMNYAKNSDKKEFIIGTEISIAEHLQYDCPDKKFHILTQKLICPNMKATTLMDVFNCLKGEGGEEIILDEQTITDAKKCIDEMIRLGG